MSDACAMVERCARHQLWEAPRQGPALVREDAPEERLADYRVPYQYPQDAG